MIIKTSIERTRGSAECDCLLPRELWLGRSVCCGVFADWVRDLGEELVIGAMKRALERNKTSWSYVKSILKAWYKKGIRTVDDARARQVASENERRQRYGGSGGFSGGNRDIIPDSYKEGEGA